MRTFNDTPTGIDRVEMAYARHLDSHYRHCTRYLVTLNGYPQIIPSQVIRKFINVTQAVWSDASGAASTRSVDNLASFLDIPAMRLRGDTRANGKWRARSAMRRFGAAQILLHSALGQIHPRRIWSFNRGLRQSVYVNVSHENLDNIHVARWLEHKGVSRSIFMVHDLIPITHPQYVVPGAPKNHALRIKTIARNASCILTNSQDTKDVLMTYLAEQNLPVPRVQVAPLAIEDGFVHEYEPIESISPYFVYVSTLEPRKNHISLLQVWDRLVEEMGPSAPKLVIVGRRGWENENILDLLERAPRIRSHVFECTNLPDAVLGRLVANARSTLFPSYVEGYGLPVVESLALGTPAICSNIKVLKEIGDDLIDQLDPLDGPEWIRAIKAYTSAPAQQVSQMRARIKQQYRAPTWTDHMHVFDNAVADFFQPVLAA